MSHIVNGQNLLNDPKYRARQEQAEHARKLLSDDNYRARQQRILTALRDKHFPKTELQPLPKADEFTDLSALRSAKAMVQEVAL
ncbi:hypothetical protein JL49_09110 [Pseudoalteromonas luteoviolacea]|nr:hypothetical protein JL49_09110 [Pseudoalteromonas luteoviolacea]